VYERKSQPSRTRTLEAWQSRTHHYYQADASAAAQIVVGFANTAAHCIDGLDSCVAKARENQEMRLRAFKGLFAIYCFSVSSVLDLGEDIPYLLVGNATCGERQIDLDLL